MTIPPLTPAQRAALEWLPTSWVHEFPIWVGQQMIELLQHDLIKHRWRGNQMTGCWEYRITQSGEAMRKELNNA